MNVGQLQAVALREQMVERGATEEEVRETILTGEEVPAKRGRKGYRKNFQYGRCWGGRYYLTKHRSSPLWPRKGIH